MRGDREVNILVSPRAVYTMPPTPWTVLPCIRQNTKLMVAHAVAPISLILVQYLPLLPPSLPMPLLAWSTCQQWQEQNAFVPPSVLGKVP